MGHPFTGLHPTRWPFEHGFEVIKNIPPDRGTVLTWGERWILRERYFMKAHTSNDWNRDEQERMLE